MTLGALNGCNESTGLTDSFDGNLFDVRNTSTGGSATALRGRNNSAAAAIRGDNFGLAPDNNGSGVTGTSVNGIGVYGNHSATTGASAGVRGQNSGTNGNGSGVFGSHAGSGIGVLGTSLSGAGVFGSHDALTGTAPGLRGDTRSTAGFAAGVRGTVVKTAPGGFSAGVRGINNGTGGLGIGVYGSHAGSGWGVYGESPSGIGVNGESDSGTGVAASNEGTAPALTATNDGDGPAAAFSADGAPFTVSSSAKVDNLNADQLDGRSAEELGGRTAVAAVISYNNGGAFEEQASIVIDAPRDGLMLVSGAVSITTLVGGDTSCDPCTGVMRLRDEVNEFTSTEQVGTFGDGSHEASAQLSNNWVFPVEAGRRTFALDTHTEGAAGDIFSDNPTLTALFVPLGPSGQGRAAAVATKARGARRR